MSHPPNDSVLATCGDSYCTQSQSPIPDPLKAKGLLEFNYGPLWELL